VKCTKFYFGWGSALDPTGGAYSAPASKGRAGRGKREKRKKKRREGRGWEDRKGEGMV